MGKAPRRIPQLKRADAPGVQPGATPDVEPPVKGIVEAVGAAVASRGGKDGKQRASIIEGAMVAAIIKCQEEGITDPDVIRKAQLDAADLAKKQLRAGFDPSA